MIGLLLKPQNCEITCVNKLLKKNVLLGFLVFRTLQKSRFSLKLPRPNWTLPASEVWHGVTVATFGVVVNPLECLHHGSSGREDAVCQQKCVEEVNAEKTQISKPIKQPVDRRMPYLYHSCTSHNHCSSQRWWAEQLFSDFYRVKRAVLNWFVQL